MSWRHLVVAILPIAIGCTEGVAPTPSASLPKSTPRLGIDPSATIKIVPNLDGPAITVTAFNNSDVIAGYKISGNLPVIFRANGAVQYFTPPAGFQAGGKEDGLRVGIDWVNNVGGSIQNDTAYRAFIWTGDTTYLLTPTYPFFQGASSAPTDAA